LPATRHYCKLEACASAWPTASGGEWSQLVTTERVIGTYVKNY